jgi:hypothetical protein
VLHGELVLRALPCRVLLDVALSASFSADVVCVGDRYRRRAAGLAFERPPAERDCSHDRKADCGYKNQSGTQAKVFRTRRSSALRAIGMLADGLAGSQADLGGGRPEGAIAAFVEPTSSGADKVEEAKRMTRRGKITANADSLHADAIGDDRGDRGRNV